MTDGEAVGKGTRTELHSAAGGAYRTGGHGPAGAREVSGTYLHRPSPPKDPAVESNQTGRKE